MPVSNIIKIPGAIMADRWLYPASAFFALFLCRLICLLFRKKETLIPIIAVSFTLFLSVFTIQRNGVFKNYFLLMSEVVRAFPDNAIAHNNLGIEHEKMGDKKEAERQYKIAIKSDQRYSTPYNIGFAYKELGNIEKSNQFYKIAISLNPENFEAYNNLALNYYEQKEYEKALEMAKKAEEIPTNENIKEKIRDNIKMITEKIKMQKPSPQQ